MAIAMFLLGVLGIGLVVVGFALAGHPAVLLLGGLMFVGGMSAAVLNMWWHEVKAHPDRDLPGFRRVG
jgi:hypothetical protein